VNEAIDWSDYIDDYESIEKSDWYDRHRDLYERIPALLDRVPAEFTSDVHIEGLDATDVFGLNEILASSVENQVVNSLNRLLSGSDFDEEYRDHEFVRQSQTFPDVLFENSAESDGPLMGIELKCWYLLAKEGDPSFRFKTTPAACAPQDLLVIYPWTLDNIVTGSPEIFRPFVMPAKFASMYVDYYWQELKNWRPDSPNKEIVRPDDVSHYPNPKTDFIQDKPAEDAGNNYGRFRSRLIASLPPLQEYVTGMQSRELLGIPADRWADFFTSYDETATIDELEDINGIGPGTAATFRNQGYTTPTQLKSALIERLTEFEGIGSRTAEDIFDDLSTVVAND
jgi:hypothetical protein